MFRRVIPGQAGSVYYVSVSEMASHRQGVMGTIEIMIRLQNRYVAVVLTPNGTNQPLKLDILSNPVNDSSLRLV